MVDVLCTVWWIVVSRWKSILLQWIVLGGCCARGATDCIATTAESLRNKIYPSGLYCARLLAKPAARCCAAAPSQYSGLRGGAIKIRTILDCRYGNRYMKPRGPWCIVVDPMRMLSYCALPTLSRVPSRSYGVRAFGSVLPLISVPCSCTALPPYWYGHRTGATCGRAAAKISRIDGTPQRRSQQAPRTGDPQLVPGAPASHRKCQ